MIITEQRIREIILEEIIKENLIQDIKQKVKDIFSKLKIKRDEKQSINADMQKFITDNPDDDQLRKVYDMIVRLQSSGDRSNPDYKKSLLILTQLWDPTKREKAEKELEKVHDEALAMNKEKNQSTSKAIPPPPPPDDEDAQEPESIGSEDIISDDESTKNVSKFNKLAQQIAGNNKEKQKQIEALLTFLEKNGHLKMDVLKDKGLLESLIKKFYGNNNMSIDKKVLKRIIKEEMHKARTDEAFEGIRGAFQGLKSGAKSAMSGEMSGGKTGRLPNLMKKSLADIAAQTKKLSLQITDIKKQADASNLQVSKELQTVIGAISRANEESTKLSTSNQQLLFPKGSPEAASDQSSQAGAAGNTGDESAAPVGGSSATQTPAGGTVKSFGKEYSGEGPTGGLGSGDAASSAQDSSSSGGTSKQVPIFKATPDSKGDVLSMKLKSLFSKAPNSDQLLTQYLKFISNQLKANNIKLMEARGDNLSAQLGGFTSKTARIPGTAANIQQGSIDLFGPAVLLLKKAGMQQKEAVTLATQIKDLTAKHLQKYGVSLPQKASRVSAQSTPPAATAQPPPAAPAAPAEPAEPPPAAPASEAQPEAATSATPPAEAPAAAPAEPAKPSAETRPEAPAPAEASAAQKNKNFSELSKGKAEGTAIGQFLRQFDEKELGTSRSQAQDMIKAIANKTGIKVEDLLAENKLNEHLISRNKKSNNSLTFDQVERMKLLAGIKK